MPITVPASEFAAVIAARLRADTARIELVALEVAQRSVAEAVKATDAADAVDQGLYKLSWSARRAPRGAVLGNSAPYAPALEYGRRPGRPGPPLAPILAWVTRKLVANGRVAEADAYGAALAIRNSIHFRGTPPRRILLRVVQQMGPWFREAAVRELRRGPA